MRRVLSVPKLRHALAAADFPCDKHDLLRLVAARPAGDPLATVLSAIPAGDYLTLDEVIGAVSTAEHFLSKDDPMGWPPRPALQPGLARPA